MVLVDERAVRGFPVSDESRNSFIVTTHVGGGFDVRSCGDGLTVVSGGVEVS